MGNRCHHRSTTSSCRRQWRPAAGAAGRSAQGRARQILLPRPGRLSVLSQRLETVARIVVCAEHDAIERLSRELAVARHLSGRRAPIVPPSGRFPAGPHFQGKFGLTLWQFVEHAPVDVETPRMWRSPPPRFARSVALSQIYPGAPLLPNQGKKSHTLLEVRLTLPALCNIRSQVSADDL